MQYIQSSNNEYITFQRFINMKMMNYMNLVYSFKYRYTNGT